MHRIVIATALPLLLTLTGCSGNYGFSSNLDPEPIEGYFSAGAVKMLDSKPDNATTVGFVSGDSCQTQADLPPADNAEARTELRQQAAAKGADAVVVQQCIALAEMPGCVSAIQCSGEALKLAQ